MNIKENFKKNWNEFITDAKNAIKEFKNKETRKKQIPNMLTASRLLAPFFIIPSALAGNIFLTALFAFLFTTTDALDGYYARKFNASSEFGRKLDPITDKVFAGSLLIPLVTYNPLMLINLILELAIAIVNTTSQLKNNNPHTLISGKAKTASLYSTIGLGYISSIIGINSVIINSFIILTGLLQNIALYEYIKEDKKHISEENDTNEIIEESENDKEKDKEKSKEEQILELNNLKNHLINSNEKTLDDFEKIYKLKK